MEINAEVLRQRYTRMETATLIELRWKKGELTGLALSVLDEVLESRGVTNKIREAIILQLEKAEAMVLARKATEQVLAEAKQNYARRELLEIVLQKLDRFYRAVMSYLKGWPRK